MKAGHSTPLYVVGPQLKLAEKWANGQGWLTGPFTYINRAEQLRGMARGTELVMLVNWHANKTKKEVDDFCDLIAAYDLKVRFVQL